MLKNSPFDRPHRRHLIFLLTSSTLNPLFVDSAYCLLKRSFIQWKEKSWQPSSWTSFAVSLFQRETRIFWNAFDIAKSVNFPLLRLNESGNIYHLPQPVVLKLSDSFFRSYFVSYLALFLIFGHFSYETKLVVSMFIFLIMIAHLLRLSISHFPLKKSREHLIVIFCIVSAYGYFRFTNQT